MLKNYIKTTLRNFKRHKSYTAINIFGFALGMACCILISLYVNEELSFDTFHEMSDRIVVVGTEGDMWGKMRATPYPLADAMVEEMPAIEKATRVSITGDLLLSDTEQNFVKIDNAKYVEPDFFELFSFDLLQGHPQEALKTPNNIILTPSAAKNIFGRSDDLIGQRIYWQRSDTVKVLQVAGIVEEAPANSTMQYDVLLSYKTRPAAARDISSWRGFSPHTYGLLTSTEAANSLSDQFDELVKAHYEVSEGKEPDQSFFSLPLEELHLSELSNNSGFTGNRAYLYLFGSVALFILGIACVNYVNLATARTSIRVKEVGVRKTLGAFRTQLISQFLGESVLISISSYVIGGIISILALPYFNQLFGTELHWQTDISFLLWLLLVASIIGVLAGFYPALYLSRFAPASVLRNKFKKGSSASWLRKTLVVIQFTLAVILIISALVVYQQLRYTQEKDLGFDGEQVVSVRLPNSTAWDTRENLKDRLRGYSSIQEVSIVSSMPGGFNLRLGYKPETISSQVKTDSNEPIIFAPTVVDYEFLKMLDIDMVAGRYFSKDLSADRNQAYVINEKAATALGWMPDDAIGKNVNFREEGKIIGVVENFHITSLKEEIEPVTLQLFEPTSWSTVGNLLVQLSPDKITNGLEIIESELKEYAPSQPFDYEFLDKKFKAMYKTEFRLGRIVVLFTIIAIIIACLGLYGLSAFAAERRTQEIGIRKVLGARIGSIVALLSKDFLKLVLLGFILAVPVA
ncbi:hypothetical protein CK503_03325 [Aliifodinibius salipaludis]|uniref:Cell division protein FtsX n=1 Tax=Fodinibius salipaludis TaxID=2032627 RepID=A0A2A2GEQ2_9BACT|nr:ABC transporter permease [Aliifodinibius salipaludis]PAU95242.1 hypothetical protein CK503_03325 [Aliifodinibius salipaludis]